MLARRASKFSAPATGEPCTWTHRQELLPNPSFAGSIDPGWSANSPAYLQYQQLGDGAAVLFRNNSGYRLDMAYYQDILVPAGCAANSIQMECSWSASPRAPATGRILFKDQADNIIGDTGNIPSGDSNDVFNFNLNPSITAIKTHLSGAQSMVAEIRFYAIYLRPILE